MHSFVSVRVHVRVRVRSQCLWMRAYYLYSYTRYALDRFHNIISVSPYRNIYLKTKDEKNSLHCHLLYFAHRLINMMLFIPSSRYALTSFTLMAHWNIQNA